MRQPVQGAENKPSSKSGKGLKKKKKKKQLATAGSTYQLSQVKSDWFTFSLPTSTKAPSQCFRRP